MKMSDYHALTADAPHTAIIVTEPDLSRPGPVIVEVNDAFSALTGHARAAIVGLTPRVLQGPDTSRLSTMNIARALRRNEPIVECLINYKADGTPYFCSLEIHPLFDAAGRLTNYVAFEREVVRRRGRPRSGFAGRFAPIDAQAMLPHELGWRLAA